MLKKEKKQYAKPDVSFVNFELSSSVAGTCKYEGNYADGNSCNYKHNGWIVYSPNSACNFPVDDEFCYHVPTADTSIFSS